MTPYKANWNLYLAKRYPPEEFKVRRYRNGGMQLVTWMVLLMVFLAGFGLGLIWDFF